MWPIAFILWRMSKKWNLSQHRRFWYLSHRWPAKAQAILCICVVSPEPSLFAHMKYESRWWIQPKIRHLALWRMSLRHDMAQIYFLNSFVTGSLDDVLTDAILKDKVKFMALILQQGVFMKEFLTIGRMEHLYSKVGNMSQLMRLWYLLHRRPAKTQVSLRMRWVWQEPSLFTHMKNGSWQRVQPKIRYLAPLDGCLKNEFTEDKKYHNLMTWLIYTL